MNVQYHPASNDAVRRLDLPCAVRSTALPLRKAGRVARGAFLALLFFLFYAGTQNVSAQVLIYEDAEIRVTAKYGLNLGPIAAAGTIVQAFKIQDKAGGTYTGGSYSFGWVGDAATMTDTGALVLADGGSGTITVTYTSDDTFRTPTLEIKLGATVVGTAPVVQKPSPFAPGQNLTMLYDGFFTLIVDDFGVPLSVNDRIEGITVTSENLLIDWTNGNPLPEPGDLTYTGSGTTSTLTMDGNLISTLVTEMIYRFDNERDGDIDVFYAPVGPPVTYTIHYFNLKPINDFLLAQTKTFDYSAVTTAPDHEIFLDGDSDSGGMGNGISYIDCVACGEAVSFTNPITRINIHAGDGSDTVTIEMIDMPIAPTFVGVYAYGGSTLVGTDGDDRFVVTPNTAYETYVDGEGQTLTYGCFGDILDVVLAGVSGAELDIVTPATGQGTWSFDVPDKAVNFTDIEGHDDASVSLDLNVTPDLVYATDFKNVVITVENTGSDQAACVAVEVPATLTRIFSEDDWAILPTLSMTDENGVTWVPGGGTYDVTTTDSTWTIGYMGPGFTATFSVGGLVSNFKRMPEQFPITASTDGVEESVLFETHPGFRFPLTTFVNSAAYVTKVYGRATVPQPTFDNDGATNVADVVFDVLVAGLFQGAPGITGAVWCKIPDVIFDGSQGNSGNPDDVLNDEHILWPGDNYVGGPNPGVETLDPPPASLGDLWRPCSGTFSSETDANPYEPGVQVGIELPFPLHVNGLYFDLRPNEPGTGTFDPVQTGVLWLATWGSAGLYKSFDGGETWLAAWPELGPGDASTGTYWTNIYAITEDEAGFLYASANDGYVLRSLNHGLTWQTVGSLPHVDSDTPWSLHGDLDVPGVVYAGTFGRGLYFTTDYGYTWEELDNLATVANENQALYSAPNNAGHIFEIEIALNPDDSAYYIFVGTGNGVWRSKLNAINHALASGWSFLGPEVKLLDNTYVRPEVHALLAIPEGFLNSVDSGDDYDLLAGLWGNFLVGGDLYSAEMFEELFGNPVGPTPLYAPYVLRGRQVEAFAVSSDGKVAVVTDKGLIILNPAQASTSTSTEPVTGELPSEYTLDQNYPNPFNPVTTIRFAVPETGKIRLAVYDVLGRQVAILVDGALQAGQHEVQFNAAGLPSGTYVYRLQTAAGSLSKTLVLMK